MKQEVTSLKGVMLNVKNFPTPKLQALDSASTSCQQPVSSAIVVSGGDASPPAWQLQSSFNVEPAVSGSEAASNVSVEVEVERQQPVVSSSSSYAAPLLLPPYAAPLPPYAAPLPAPAVEDDAEIHYEQIRPPSIPSRSASSSGSSVTSFEVIERKEYANAFVDNRQNTTLLVESDECEESVDSDSENGADGGGEMEKVSGMGGGADGGGGGGVEELEIEGGVDGGVGDNTISEEDVGNDIENSEHKDGDEAGASVLAYDSNSDKGCVEDDVSLVEEEVTSSNPEQETEMSHGGISSVAVEEVN